MRSHDLRWIPRRPSRHAVRIACQVVRERDFKLIGDIALDLSEYGLLAAPTTRVLTGESVIISFMAPFSRDWIDAEGTVARVVHGRRATDRGGSLGISFNNIDEVSRVILRNRLRSLPPSLPRGRRVASFS